jgi:dihydropteroate synthase
MGVVNVTPDSFSDGGKFLDPDRAIEHALALVEEGADFLDIGGESSRPRGNAYGAGAEPVPAERELERVLPVIEGVRKHTDIPISIDTVKSEVARAAMEAGATLVNDISAFHRDPAMPEVVGKGGATAVLMHMRGTPQTMQQDTRYEDLFGEITAYFRDALALGARAGIRQMLIDPGIGFGKSVRDNLRLVQGIDRFLSLGVPILVGPSRKSFIGEILSLPVEDRLEGTLAAVAVAAMRGASVVRVHDVRAAVRVVRMVDAFQHAGG